MPNILDMTLQQLSDAGIEISIQINTWPRKDSPPSQPSKPQLRDALQAYASKFGGPAARQLIGEGTTLDDIKDPTALYQQILVDLEAAVPPGGEK